MNYVGLVPSENSTGASGRLGAITKTGSRHARRLLGEAAWHYRKTPSRRVVLQRRQNGQPGAIIAISCRVQRRLYQVWRRPTPSAANAARSSRSPSPASCIGSARAPSRRACGNGCAVGDNTRAKSDRPDARHQRELLMIGRLSESCIPLDHILGLRARARLRHTLAISAGGAAAYLAVLYHYGSSHPGDLLSDGGRAWLNAQPSRRESRSLTR
jgi:hypothetical protein